MKQIIITGTSRGIGQALAKELLIKGHQLFCISRTDNQQLIAQAAKKNIPLNYYNYDLSDKQAVGQLVSEIFTDIDLAKSQGLYLINNAGVLAPIKPIEKIEADEIEHNIAVNLVAPMILTARFLELSSRFKGEKRVINISSGAAKKPYSSWSAYCTAKAGIDMFSKNIALEQVEREFGAEIISLAPGVVDTKMQQEIRANDEKAFKAKERFVKLAKNNQLLAPKAVASKIGEILFAPDFAQNGIVIDIRDLI